MKNNTVRKYKPFETCERSCIVEKVSNSLDDECKIINKPWGF
jgi:hypothetical protein